MAETYTQFPGEFTRSEAIAAEAAWDTTGAGGTAAAMPLLPAARSTRKRALDIVLATVALVLLAPALALMCVAIVLDSGWPPLFCQHRVGLNGRRFRMWKLRTMIRDAEEMRTALEALNEAPFPAFKMKRDPRVTRVGRLLRRTSMDELPQLWNVVRGEMSLVGPRPPLPSEVVHYNATAMRRLSVRPGITCIWQIEARHAAPVRFQDWASQDIRYIESWTLWLDIVLLVRTVRVVARMDGQ